MRTALSFASLFLAGLASAGEVPFAARPTARRDGDKTIISFAVSRETDVAVYVDNAKGEVVRHLVAGVLGKDPPPPLKPDSLEQSIEWDGKADYGKPAEGGPFKARVALGLGARYDKVVSSNRQNIVKVTGLGTGPDGTLYVLAATWGAVWEGPQILAFSRDGAYQRTVMPFPTSLKREQVGGITSLELDGRPAPLLHNIRMGLYPHFSTPCPCNLAVSPDGAGDPPPSEEDSGRVARPFASANGPPPLRRRRLYLPCYDHHANVPPSIGMLDAEGGCPADKLFFFGFEKDQVLARWLKASKDEGDTCYVYWPGDRGRCLQALQKGDATEGEWAAAIRIGEKLRIQIARDDLTWLRTSNYDLQNYSSLPWNWFRPGFLANLTPPEKFTQTVETTEWTGYSSPGGRLESSGPTHSSHARFYTRYAEGGVRYTDEALPRDWRGYSFLRMDVKSETGGLSLRMAFEDLQIAPPVEKRFVVPAGAWHTLELDLDKAAEERKVDLGGIVNFWAYVEEVAQPGTILVDNVRLSKRGVPAKLPVIPGGPKVPRPVAPMPKAEAGSIRREAGRLSLGEPSVLTVGTGKRPAGWLRLWAYGNLRLVLMAEDSATFFTLDGGANWQPVRGRLWLPSGISSNPQAATDMDASGNILFFGNFGACVYHCAPPVDSMYFRSNTSAE